MLGELPDDDLYVRIESAKEELFKRALERCNTGPSADERKALD